MPCSRIILYVPELISAQFPAGRDRPRLLEKFFSRARTAHVENETTVLQECFGLLPEEFPVAALERLGGTGIRDQARWWRADPVHLAADRDQLVMLPQASLVVTTKEMRQITETFNRNYAAEGYKLEFQRPERGYLQVPADWHCRSWNPTRVEGQAVTEFMPTGPHSDALKKIMTEIQMLFHEHPVNRAREAAGQPTINSLWLWGGGRLPERLTRSPARIFSSLPLVRGLATLAGQTVESWSMDVNVPGMEGEWLIALSLKDFDGDVSRLESGLLAPLWRALLRGRIQQIRFYPGGDYLYELTRRSARRFWRRTRPMSERLREPNEQPAD